MAVREPDENNNKKSAASSKQPQRYSVQPKDMTTGEMYTLQELVQEFGSRFVLRIHEYKKQQVWEMFAETDTLAKYAEWRLTRQRKQQAHLEYCLQRVMTDPLTAVDDPEPKPALIPYPDALRHIELHILHNPLKWDLKTGREPEKKR